MSKNEADEEKTYVVTLFFTFKTSDLPNYN